LRVIRQRKRRSWVAPAISSSSASERVVGQDGAQSEAVSPELVPDVGVESARKSRLQLLEREFI
jgi:hypothetical protein